MCVQPPCLPCYTQYIYIYIPTKRNILYRYIHAGAAAAALYMSYDLPVSARGANRVLVYADCCSEQDIKNDIVDLPIMDESHYIVVIIIIIIIASLFSVVFARAYNSWSAARGVVRRGGPGRIYYIILLLLCGGHHFSCA